jgi:glycosyltransferase involved in cell wall biosynthesis
MKIAFVTNICSHYRVKTFEELAKHHTIDYIFFSAGEEWYWQRQHGISKGEFHNEYLKGFHIGNTRITPTLPWKLWTGHYDVYIKCINGRFALPITFIVSKLRAKPFILWTGIWTRINTPMHRLFFPITRYIYKKADAIVVYGEHVKRYLISEGVAAEKVFVTKHAIDNQVYQKKISQQDQVALRESLGLAIDQKVILYLGRLEKSKGSRYLIEAFSKVSNDNSVLVIVGTGRETANIQSLVSQHNLQERVHFTDYVPTDQTMAFYSIARVFVLPSISVEHGKEPWGLVINEAFNQSVPVVATDAVGAVAGGLVEDQVNGLIVPEKDSQAMADALKILLENDELHQQMGCSAFQKINEWGNEEMIQGFLEAIRYVTRK